MKYRILLYFLFFLIFAAKPQTVEAQNVAISTNAVDWLNFGTANIGVGVDVSRHFSVEAGARYNPWSFSRKSSGLAVMNRQAKRPAFLLFFVIKIRQAPLSLR